MRACKKRDFPVCDIRRFLDPGPVVLVSSAHKAERRCSEIRQRGPSPLASHFFKSPCAINAAMLKAERTYRAELKKVTVADLNTDPASPLGKAINTRACAFLILTNVIEHQRERVVS